MGSWKLLVEDYGKIRSAELEMAPLTLFVGDNNSGKSFLMSLLWGIENLGIESMLGYSYVETEETNVLITWISKQLDLAIKKGKHTSSAAEIAEPLENLLNNELKKNKDNFVKTLFNSNQVTIGKMAVKFKDLSDTKLEFQIDGRTGLKVFSKSPTWFYGITASTLADESWREDRTVLWFFLKGIYCLIMDVSMQSEDSGCIYLPAARTGFMLTKDIINKTGRDRTFNFSTNGEITPFSQPIRYFLDAMDEMSHKRTGSTHCLELAHSIEREMADGEIEISSMQNKEAQYTPDGFKESIPLQLASAVVTGLSPIILMLKHVVKIKKFYYEEPEMCLHPQLQHKMGKIICRAVNSGINMIVTTHSDIILQHVNNMIRLCNREDRAKIYEKFGYSKQDTLTSEQVKVYQFESKIGTVVEELPCGENGFIVPKFNNALDKIMDEAYEIQGIDW